MCVSVDKRCHRCQDTDTFVLFTRCRCVGNDAEEIQGRNEHLLQPNNEESKSSLDRRSSDGVGGVGDPISSHGSNGHLADIMGSNAGEQVRGC